MKRGSKAKAPDVMLPSPSPSLAAESATLKAASGEGEPISPFLKSGKSEQKSPLDPSMAKSKLSDVLKGIPEKSDPGN